MCWHVIVLAVIIGASTFASTLAPYDPMQTAPAIQMQSPTTEHLLGTDVLGRDVFSRLLFGGQRTLLVSALATGVAVVIGLAVGVSFGTANSWRSKILATLTSALLAFPNLLLAMVVMTILGIGLLPLAIATGFAQIAAFARVIHAAVISVSAEAYMESGHAIGATRWHITRYYVFPNILTTFLTYTALTFTYCLLNSAALSFLGLGGEPGVPDWGVMLAEGRNAFRDAPWIAIAPGLAITLTVWSINSLVDHLLVASARKF
jgi:peptide/nickel transport system permease protein